jgi:hypothetical protein
VTLRVALAVGALLLAGCGGTASTGASAASITPPDTLGFVEVDTDLESDQWQAVQELMNRFPDSPQLVQLLNEQLREEGLEYERDVAPALGETVAFVFNGAEEEDLVVLTQPDDDAKFDALIEELEQQGDDELVTGEVDGWRAAAESQALIDALADAEGSLAEDDAFEAALDEAPDARLAFGFVRGELADDLPQYANSVDAEWASFAVEARENGPAATFAVRGANATTGEAYTSDRVDQAPADALAFLSFNGESLRSQTSLLAPLAQLLGARIDTVLEGLEGEGALWITAGGGIPQFTLVVETDDAEAARTALLRLLPELPLQVRVGVVDGQLVATTAPSPELALDNDGESLGDAEDFKEAVEAAGMPDETSGFLFLDVADALGLLTLAEVAGADVPDELVDNLRPLRSVVAWSESEGDTSSGALFVEIQ